MKYLNIVEDIMDKWFPEASMFKTDVRTAGSSVNFQKVEPVFKDGGFTDSFIGSSDYKSSNTLITNINASINNKKEYRNKIESIKTLDLVESIIRAIMNDVFNKYYDKNLYKEFFRISINKAPGVDKDKEIELEEELKDMLYEYEIKDLLKERMPEFLYTGELIFKIDFKNKEIDDVIDTEKLLTIYLKNTPNCLIDTSKDKKEDMLKSVENYLIFKLYSSVVNLQIRSKSGSYFTVRYNRGIFSEGVISKFITLNLLENMIPLIEVSNMSKKMYYYMRVPPGTDSKSAFKLARNYELMLMSLLKVDKPKNVDELLNLITKIKVIPLFGENQEIAQNDLAPMERIDLNYINDLKESIATSMKIPKSFIMMTDSSESNINPEYIQMIMYIREALAQGIKLLCYNYLKHKYPNYNIKLSNISVKTPKIAGSDDLESIDYTQLLSQSVTDINQLIGDVLNTIDQYRDNENVDIDGLVDFFNDKLKALTNKNILKRAEPKKDKDENLDDDFDRSDDNISDVDNITSDEVTDEDSESPKIKGLDTGEESSEEISTEPEEKSIKSEVNT